MSDSAFRPPPMVALIPFEAAARLGSMSAAARELGISQPAISRHLAVLEKDLGQALFIRTRRGLRLTSAGLAYQAAVAPALGQIREATLRLRPRGAGRSLRLAANFGFAQQWLMPLLPALRRARPDLVLHLLTGDREEELALAEADLSIRFGAGVWPGQRAVRLFTEEAFPICSPDCLARHPGLADGDLGVASLLHMEESRSPWFSWESWLAACGAGRPAPPRRLIYPTYPLLLQAALAGEGVALGWRGLVDELVAEGRLVQLMPGIIRADRGYFLCLPEAPTTAARSVAEWLQAAAQTKMAAR